MSPTTNVPAAYLPTGQARSFDKNLPGQTRTRTNQQRRSCLHQLIEKQHVSAADGKHFQPLSSLDVLTLPLRSLRSRRVDLADVLASLHRPSSSALANSAGSAADDERRPRTKAQIRADLATIAKLKLKLFFTPGAFRKLAKQAMLAEGRAFERCVKPPVCKLGNM